MATGTITSWAGNITDIGPMYPFVGSEGMLVVVAVVFWLVWHVWQMRIEQRDYDEDIKRLRNKDLAKKVIDREG
jgi:hypothetical protein